MMAVNTRLNTAASGGFYFDNNLKEAENQEYENGENTAAVSVCRQIEKNLCLSRVSNEWQLN